MTDPTAAGSPPAPRDNQFRPEDDHRAGGPAPADPTQALRAVVEAVTATRYHGQPSLAEVDALLALAIRPRLGGGSGFMRYAAATPEQLLGADLAITAEQLIWMARLTRTKYRCLRWAVDLILVGLVATTATAVLTALGSHG